MATTAAAVPRCSTSAHRPTTITCSICCGLDFTQQPGDRWNIHDRDLISSTETCKGCSTLALAVETYRQLGSESFFVVSGESRRNCTVGDRLVSVDIFTAGPSSGLPLGFPSVPDRRLVSPDGLSESCLKIAKSWLQTCASEHAQCRQNPATAGDWLPTRLIDVGIEGEAPRLVITKSVEGEKEYGGYVALSHCWGGHQPLRLLEENLASFLQEIPVSQLPRTFLDTIFTTRFLGCRYIWIDSLCIIQDSSDDWQHEATMMLQVYQNSVLTVIADAGGDSTSGIASQSRRQEWQQTRLGQEEHRLWARRGRLDFFVPTGLASHCPATAERSWVNARGWTFQERIMPPRKLHFGAYEMAWECRTLRDCECSGGGDDDATVTASSAVAAADGQRIETSTIFSNFWQDANADEFSPSLWMDIVEEYTKRQLSFPGDTLLAIAGLAALIMERHDDEVTYLAGLWKEYLPEMLLWRVEHGVTPARRHDKYYAPSWTWACRVSDEATRIKFDRFDEHSVLLAEFGIVDSGCEYPRNNPLLPPCDGFIDIEALVVPLYWHAGTLSFVIPCFRRFAPKSDHVAPHADGYFWMLKNGDDDDREPAIDVDMVARIEFAPDEMPDNFNDSFSIKPHHFMPIWRMNSPANQSIHGLVMTVAEEQQTPAYQRQGSGVIESVSDDDWKAWEDICPHVRVKLI